MGNIEGGYVGVIHGLYTVVWLCRGARRVS